MVALQLVEGRPELIVENAGGSLKLRVNATLHDDHWHTLHITLDAEVVMLMVDLCGQGWEDGAVDSSHCLARQQWRGSTWPGSGPLQVGGVAQSPLLVLAEHHGWRETPTTHNLYGCLAHLTINTRVVDLGEPAFSQGSSSGCGRQEGACSGLAGMCGVRGRCEGGLKHPQCDCDPGWMGPACATPTLPVTLGVSSYMKLALSFTPAPWRVSVQVRVRTRGRRDGILLHLAAQHHAAAFAIYVRTGVACATVSGTGWATNSVCVEDQPLGDGEWHTVQSERHGHSLVISVDHWHTNESLSVGSGLQPSPPLHLDKHDGVSVGGLPEFIGVRLVTVHQDLHDTCLDDLRVSGHILPLSPAINGTSWGQATSLQHLESGCHPFIEDPCHNITCAAPLTCHPHWDLPQCSCGLGRQLQGQQCVDIDECMWHPCLHGGTCQNQQPGYLCTCGPSHLGDHCQWKKLTGEAHPMASTAAVVALTISVFILVVVGVVLSLRLHRLRASRPDLQQMDTAQKSKISSIKDERGSHRLTEDSRYSDDTTSAFLLQLLKLNRKTDELGEKVKKGSRSGGDAGGGEGVGLVVVQVEAQPAQVDPKMVLPGEDLRFYAYEGDGSSSGSFTSTISGRDQGLRAELEDEDVVVPLVPGFVEVIDLLKNLPEGHRSSIGSTAGATVTTQAPDEHPQVSSVASQAHHITPEARSTAQRQQVHTPTTTS